MAPAPAPDPRRSRELREVLLAKIPEAGTAPPEVLREAVEHIHDLTEEDLRAIYLAIGSAARRAPSDELNREGS